MARYRSLTASKTTATKWQQTGRSITGCHSLVQLDCGCPRKAELTWLQITAASTYVWTSVTKHQAQPHPPMIVLRFRAPQHPPTKAPRNMHIWCQLDQWLNYARNRKFAYTTQNKPRARRKSKRCRLIMHRRIGLSAGIVSIGRMPGCIVEKFEVWL